MLVRSDSQLLHAYAEHGDEAAFRELVTRHTDFVYSAALRQVESSGVAADLTQATFVDLARKARSVGERLAPTASLVGWLHRSTRYAVLNHLRDTRRRLNHERLVMEQFLTDTEPAADWEQIRPALDEALDSLSDEDREALLLRYFKNQDYRAVGRALGVSDDTAQKRVSRAVERLREFFAQRGVTVGASGLAIVITANGVQAAPAGLAVTISAAALLTGTAVSTSTVIAATKTIAMTTLQKTLVTATVALVAGAGIYEARQAAQLREQNQTLQQQQAPLAEQIHQLQRERDETTNRLAGLHDELAKLNSNNLELMKLRGEVGLLRYQAAEAASPHSDLEMAWRSRFDVVYKLKSDELVRYIAPPFIPERTNYYHTEKEWQISAAHHQAPPTFFIFHQNNTEQLHGGGITDGGFGNKAHSLQQILHDILGIEESQVEAPKELLAANLPGDWTIRDGVTPETLLPALEPILFKALGHQVHFEKQLVTREVIAVHGQFLAADLQKVKSTFPIQIYSEKTNSTFMGSGFGNLQEFLDGIGYRLKVHFVNEVQIDQIFQDKNTFLFECAYHADADAPRMGNRRAELTDKVLKNLAAQTSLTFTPTKKDIVVWVITDQP